MDDNPSSFNPEWALQAAEATADDRAAYWIRETVNELLGERARFDTLSEASGKIGVLVVTEAAWKTIWHTLETGDRHVLDAVLDATAVTVSDDAVDELVSRRDADQTQTIRLNGAAMQDVMVEIGSGPAEHGRIFEVAMLPPESPDDPVVLSLWIAIGIEPENPWPYVNVPGGGS